MANRSSFEDLIKFIDYLSKKGLLKETTASSRKAVANKVFESLDEVDRADVLAVDIEDAMSRFINKAGNNYSPGSLQTYQARLRSTLDDFAQYLENPMGFRPSITTRNVRKRKHADNDTATSKEVITAASQPATRLPTSSGPTLPSADIFPIPLRSDLVVRIQGLPHDLSAVEASKISAIIRAFVVEE